MGEQKNFSIEILIHFQCQSCGKWWSIGDADRQKRQWFCPWCGCAGEYVLAEPARDGVEQQKGPPAVIDTNSTPEAN